MLRFYKNNFSRETMQIQYTVNLKNHTDHVLETKKEQVRVVESAKELPVWVSESNNSWKQKSALKVQMPGVWVVSSGQRSLWAGDVRVGDVSTSHGGETKMWSFSHPTTIIFHSFNNPLEDLRWFVAANKKTAFRLISKLLQELEGKSVLWKA